MVLDAAQAAAESHSYTTNDIDEENFNDDMYCQNCNTYISQSDSYCTGCGIGLDWLWVDHLNRKMTRCEVCFYPLATNASVCLHCSHHFDAVYWQDFWIDIEEQGGIQTLPMKSVFCCGEKEVLCTCDETITDMSLNDLSSAAVNLYSLNGNHNNCSECIYYFTGNCPPLVKMISENPCMLNTEWMEEPGQKAPYLIEECAEYTSRDGFELVESYPEKINPAMRSLVDDDDFVDAIEEANRRKREELEAMYDNN